MTASLSPGVTDQLSVIHKKNGDSKWTRNPNLPIFVVRWSDVGKEVAVRPAISGSATEMHGVSHTVSGTVQHGSRTTAQGLEYSFQ